MRKKAQNLILVCKKPATFAVVDKIKMAMNIRAVIELKNRFGCHTSWACLWFLVSSHPHHQSARISNPWFDVFVNFHGGFLTLEQQWVGKMYVGAILKFIPMIFYFTNILLKPKVHELWSVQTKVKASHTNILQKTTQ